MAVAIQINNDSQLNLEEAALALGESVNVIRNWLKELNGFIPGPLTGDLSDSLSAEAIETLAFVKELSRNQGFTLKQIRFFLTQCGKKRESDRSPQPIDPSVKDQLQEINHSLACQEAFNRELLKKIEAQQKLIESLLVRDRDQYLIQAMNRSHYEKQQELKSKKGLSRLFLK
ncbi:MerR family transcriptional regulator [Bacillus testis]|uniref:MerR family transcriptional regulator n=1 Tax=Bacillus testis TaxID=1622072 RepID=UPI00067E88DD|nr:MerR family transcriptional regulator [Bacillus testis]